MQIFYLCNLYNLRIVLTEFLNLHRTLASNDMDKTLAIIGSYMPDFANYTIGNYAPLTPVWTWKIIHFVFPAN